MAEHFKIKKYKILHCTRFLGLRLRTCKASRFNSNLNRPIRFESDAAVPAHCSS